MFPKGLEARNCTVKTGSLVSILPSGDYKLIIYTFNNDESVSTATFLGTFITPNKVTSN